MKIVVHLLRFFIGAILASTAIGKFLDVPGFMGVLRTYQTFPDFSIPVLAIAMPTAEAILGAFLLWGRQLNRAAAGSALLHLCFTALASITLLRGIDVPNCGCFGVFYARPLTWSGTVVEDLVMFGLSLILWWLSRRR